ncbi:MAG: hypothetical protein JSS27_03260 [Planctomycetes bacterium]|nr:hypothetical protein [Planctomycetota bacterium]
MPTSFDHHVLDPAQSRLRLRADLTIAPHDDASFVIEDPLSGKYFLVGKAEWSFLKQLDGSCTVGEAIGRAATQAGRETVLSEQEGIAVARWLITQSLARPVEFLAGATASERPRDQASVKWPNPISLSLGSFNPDRMLVAVGERLGWLWSGWFFALWSCIALATIVKLGMQLSHWQALPEHVLDRNNWLRMGAVWCVLKLIHEFGHGLSCRHYGIPVRRAGLLLVFLSPVPFVDVSGSWRLASRGQRMSIAAAGMYLELLIAFGAILLWKPATRETFDLLCQDIVALAGLNTIVFNANPLMRFDGYYLLADLVGISNLYSQGQQAVSSWARFWFRGADVSVLRERTWRGWFVVIYGFLSCGWRWLTFFGIAISLIAEWGWWGAAASVVVAWFWFGWKMPKLPQLMSKGKQLSPPGLRRRRLAVAMLATLTLLLAGWLLSPAHVCAPAIVEYAPLNVMRARASGFVTAVHVQVGAAVEANQLLLELNNDDLKMELMRVEAELAQAKLRSRGYLSKAQYPNQQRERELVESLTKQLDELRAQVNELQVRAPRAATVVSSNLADLCGRYVELGETLIMLGSDDHKELLVSAASTDQRDLESNLLAPVRVFRELHPGHVEGRLERIEPRAGDQLPHVALGADAGGDVVVTVESKASDEFGQAGYASLTRRVVAKVALDATASRQFRAGQRVFVRLAVSQHTWAGRILDYWRDCLTEVSARSRGTLQKTS